MNFIYKCFGLVISSEIELPELILEDAQSSIDVKIVVGENPENLEDATFEAVGYEVGDKELLLKMDGLASFHVTQGERIVVDKKCNDCEKDIRLFILGTCMGTILLQRNILALHASAFEFNGEAVLICGNSGVGKSSTANAFRLDGHKMLTDDICPIEFSEDKISAVSGYPQSKMWEDSLNALEIKADNLETIRKEINKRKVPINSTFFTGSLPIKRMYLLTKYNGDTLQANAVTQGNKLNCILKMTFRKYLIKEMKVQVGHFLNSSRFASNIEIRRVRRPNDCQIDALKIFIKNDILKN